MTMPGIFPAQLFIKMSNKKAQIQIFETIAVLVVFFILLGIGFIFYTKFIKSNIESDMAEISQGKSVSIAQRAMALPEIQCSDDNVPKEDCIDTLKLESAIFVIPENSLYYYDLFEFSEITISEIYPNPGAPAKALYTRAAPNDYKAQFKTRVPVTLYNPIIKTNRFGMMEIVTYTK